MFDYDEYLQEQELYLSENEHIFAYYNPHPDNKHVGDCVKRALTKATGWDYHDVQLALNRYKKVTKTKVFNEAKNFVPFIEKELEGKKLPQYRNVKVGEFAKQHQSGAFVAKVRRHVVAVVDGKVYDTWNSSFKAITKVWQIKEGSKK